MRRLPNPWISIPSVVLGLISAALAWIVTSVSCDLAKTFTGCLGWSVGVAAVAFVAVTSGTALILVLVYRSLAEWNEKREES